MNYKPQKKDVDSILLDSIVIKEQKEIADELLECLSIVCPNVILAGGAPRDWYMGNPANDLDIYLALPDLTYGSNKRQLSKVLPEEVVTVKGEYETHSNPLYKHMKHLKRIYYLRYKGIDVQIIQLNEVKDVWNTVDNIDCSICKAWYKNGKVNTTTPFMKTIKSGVMFLTEAYQWEDYHPAKMKERFEPLGFRCGTEKQADTSIINNALREEK